MRRVLLGSLCTAVLALCQSANATILKISLDPDTHLPSDVPFNSIGGNPVSVFGWLQGEILSWNNNIGTPDLPDPTTGHERTTDFSGGTTVQVEAGDYIVAHYGVGNEGEQGTGGGLVAYYADAAQAFTLPSNGEGPNGTGGISFVDVWDHTGGGPGPSVPDGGTTWAMLGAGMLAMGLFGRVQKQARA